MLRLVDIPGRLLNERECHALDWLTEAFGEDCVPNRDIAEFGIKTAALESLAELGLVEKGKKIAWPYADGWRLTDWRCMFGMTEKQIMRTPDSRPVKPFRVYRWPRELGR